MGIRTKLAARSTLSNWPNSNAFELFDLAEWASVGAAVFTADDVDASPSTGVFEINDICGGAVVLRQPAGQVSVSVPSEDPCYCGAKPTIYFAETSTSANDQYLTATGAILPTGSSAPFAIVIADHAFSKQRDLVGLFGNGSNLYGRQVNGQVRWSLNTTRTLTYTPSDGDGLNRRDAVTVLGRGADNKLFIEWLSRPLGDFVRTTDSTTLVQGLTSTPTIGRMTATTGSNPNGRLRSVAFIKVDPATVLSSGNTILDEIKQAMAADCGLA